MANYRGDIIRLRGKFFDAYDSYEYAKAIEIGKELLSVYEENEEEDTLEYANDINNVAIVYDDLMAYDKAIDLYEKAAEIKHGTLGENSLSYADTISNMAVSLSLEGKHNAAIAVHKKVLRIREAHLEENHKDCIVALFNLGSSYEDLEKYDNAIQCLDCAIKRADKQPEISKKNYADILCGYARALAKKGNFQKAISIFCKAVEIIKTEEGEKNFYYLSILLEVASVCERAKFYDQAVVYYKRALESRKILLEKTHLDFVRNFNVLAKTYVKKGDYDRAIETHKQGLNLLKAIVGDEHHFYAESMNNLGMDYLGKGDFKKALEILNETLALQEKICGQKHLSYTVTQESVGKVYMAQGDFKKAMEIFTEVKILRKQLGGEEEPLYVDSLVNIGRLYLQQDLFKGALEHFKAALKIRKKADEGKDVRIIGILELLATTMEKKRDYDAALSYMNEALSIRKKIFGRNHPRFARGLYYLSQIEMKDGRYEDAVNNLEFSMEILGNTVGESNLDYKDAQKVMRDFRSFLCEYYFRQGKYQEVLVHFDKGVETFSSKEVTQKYQFLLKHIYVYLGMGKVKEALNLLEEIRINIEKLCGKDSLEFADVLIAYAKFEMEKLDIEKAEDLLTQALEIEKKKLGNEERSLSEVSVLLGDCYFKVGDYKKASNCYEKASKNIENPLFVKAQVGLGLSQMEQKNEDKAYVNFLAALKSLEKMGNLDTMGAMIVIECIARIDVKRKNYDKAAESLKKVVDFKRSKNIVDEIFVEQLEELAKINKKLGNKEASCRNYSEAAAVVSEKQGVCEELLCLLLKTALSNVELKNYSIAEKLYVKSAEISHQLYGKHSDEFGEAIHLLLKLYKKTKEKEKGQECIDTLLEIKDKNLLSKFNSEKYNKILEI